jgi:predicted dehydrogenase
MKIWKFGVVGAGLIADFHARAINDIANAELVGFCDVKCDRARRLAEKYSCRTFSDYQEMARSADIEILTIATPSGFHAEPTIAAAKQNKHVICEKPLEISLERIDAMIDAHYQAGTKLGGIFPYRFNEAMNPLGDAIESGRFGTITYAGVYVPWWRTDEYYKDSWHGTWKLDGGGAMMNQSIHMIDMLCDLMPPVESVQAYTHNLGHPQIETEDTAVVSLRFASGAVGIIYGTTASWPGQFRRFEITGTKGTVVYTEDSFTTWQFADETGADDDIRRRFGLISGGGGVADPAAITHENHTKNFRAFIDSLESGEEFLINGPEARKAVELIIAIYRSAAEGTRINLK